MKRRVIMSAAMVSLCALLFVGCSKNNKTTAPDDIVGITNNIETEVKAELPKTTPKTEEPKKTEVPVKEEPVVEEKNVFEGLTVGDTVKFGVYEQDSDTSDGKEEIEWIVLEDKGNSLMLISTSVLECKEWDESYKWRSWAECELRKYLNDEFYNIAFSQNERSKILKTSVPLNGFSDTQDYVYLLGSDDIKRFYSFNSSDMRKELSFSDSLIVPATPYAINSGVECKTITQSDYSDDLSAKGFSQSVIGQQGAFWWLRDCYNAAEGCPMYISPFGTYGRMAEVDANNMGVRPVICVSK